MNATQNEEQRQATLDALELDDFATTAFDDLTRMAAGILETPMASISIIDQDRGWVKAHVGLGHPVGAPRESFFSAHAVQHPQELLVVEDTTKDERFAANPSVIHAPFIRFYAAAPLTLSSGYAIGALCVMDTKPRTQTIALCEWKCSNARPVPRCAGLIHGRLEGISFSVIQETRGFRCPSSRTIRTTDANRPPMYPAATS